MGAIDDFLERSQRILPKAVGGGSPGLCLVLCDDASLTGRFEATGDGAAVIRLPAASGALSEDVLQRAVAKAAVVGGCTEVLLVSHAQCSLATRTANDVLDAMKARGVTRASVPYDVREWLGAGRDPREAARQSAELLRRCAFLPKGLRVDVAHFDDASGQLTLVDRGETSGGSTPSEAVKVGGYAPGPAKLMDEESTPPPLPVAASAPPPRVDPPPLPASAPSDGGQGLARAVAAVQDFVLAKMAPPDRAELVTALERSSMRKESPHKMSDLVFRHVLLVRGSREAIGNQLLLVRKALPGLQPRQAYALLHGMIAKTAKR